MGIKKRNDITAVDLVLSEDSEKFLKELSAEDPLKRLVDAVDLPSQLSALKEISSVLRTGDQGDRSCRTVQMLLDAFCELPVKNQLAKAISSLLASLCTFWHSRIYGKLQEFVRLICAVDVADANAVRNALMKISLLYDNFTFGDEFHDCNFSVLCFLSSVLQQCLFKIRLCGSPTEKNNVMADTLLTIQLLNKVIQKSMSNWPGSIALVAHNDSDFKTTIKNAIDIIYHILMDETFITDCHTAAGMFFPLLIKWLNRDNLLALTSKYLIAMDSDGDADLPSKTCLVEYLEERNFSELPVQSRICIFHGILAVFDVRELTAIVAEEKTFLVDVVGCQLLDLLPVVSEKNAKLLFSRTLVLLATKMRLAAESSDETNLHAQLHGAASLPGNLVKYSRLHWDDPVDVVRHQAKVVFEQVIGCHLAVAGKEPQKSACLLELMRSLLEMDWSLKAKYGPLSCLVRALGASSFLDHCNDLPQLLIDAVQDQTTACHVSEFLEKLYQSHLSELQINVCEDCGDLEDGKKFSSWCSTWVDPILKLLMKGNVSQKSNGIEYIVPNLLRLCPRSLAYICAELTQVFSPSDEQLGTLITCLKYAKSSGILETHCMQDVHLKNVFSGQLLKQALCHTNAQIRLDAVGLLCEHSKTTETVQSTDLDLIKFFLSLNLSNQSPAFRQHLVAVMKKLFIRLRDSGSFLHRQYCSVQTESEKTLWIKDVLQAYSKFFHYLCDLCFDALRCGASFPNRTSALTLLSMLIHIIGNEDLQSDGLVFHFVEAISAKRLQLLMNCFNDTFEQNKMEAYRILISMPKRCFVFLDHSHLRDLLSAGLELAQSPRPQDCTTAACLLQFLVNVPNFSEVLKEQKGYSKAGVSNLFSLSPEESTDFDLERNRLCLAFVLLDLLKEEVMVATSNLMFAAATKPMYPTLHCIRYILRDVSYRQLINVDEWRHLLSSLIDICFQISAVVASVVNNSSPEGNIPVELNALPMFPTEQNSNLYFEPDNNCDSAEVNVPLDPESKVRLMPEYLVVCGWRSIKEVSLVLGQLSSAVPIIDPIEHKKKETFGLLNVQQLHLIGAYFTQQLLESRHRGAFELAYAGFVQMTNMLWNCTVEGVHELPNIWLNEVMLKVKVHDPDDQLCSTRRSAGVPFYIQALVTTEPLSRGRRSFKQTMSELLQTASQSINKENTAQVHARNILRALFRDTRLGEDVYPYIADGIKVAILGYKSSLWPIRNSSTLLFSSLMTRIFGVKPTKNDHIHRNFLTGRVFFSRFPSLFEFLLEQMQEATAAARSVGLVHLHPSLYPVLMIFGRLCPSVVEGSSSMLGLEQLVPYVIRCAGSVVYKIRQMAARAIVPLVAKEKLADILSVLLQSLPAFDSDNKCQNLIHGTCLQVSGLLDTISTLPMPLQRTVISVVIPHLKNRIWILTRQNSCFITRLSFAKNIQSTMNASCTSDLDDPLKEDLIFLGSCIITQSKTEILSFHDVLDPSPIPGQLQYMCDIASLALDCITHKRFFNSLDLVILIKSLLTSNSYDLQIEAFHFIISTFINCQSDSLDDSFCQRNYSHHWDVLEKKKIQDCLISCEEIREILLHLVLNKDQQSSKSLALAVKALKLLSQHLSSSSVDGNFLKLWNISKIRQIVQLLAISQRDEVKSCALELINLLVPLLYNSVTKKDVESEEVLNCLCDLMEVLSNSYQNPDIRMAACRILVDNASHLLVDTDDILGRQFYKMWTITFRLLQDEDCSIREMASRLVAIFGSHPSCLLRGGITWQNVQSSLALRICLEVFVNLHNNGFKPWLPEGFSTLLDWLLNDVEPANLDEEEDIRLFDRGEMNTYRDELHFADCIAVHLKTTVPKIVACFQQQQTTDTTSKNSSVENLTRQFCALLDDSLVLHQSLAESFYTAYVHNSKYVASSVEFVRKMKATDWLVEILNGLMSLPESAPVKLAELKSSRLLSTAVTWLKIADVLDYYGSAAETV